MKKSLYTILYIGLIFALVQCQVFKEPAAKVMSTTLPTPKLEDEESNLVAADFDLQVSDLEGKQVDMRDFKGKVIFLNFWATWCMPCVAELPSIEKLHQEFRGDVVFLLISNESPEKVKAYRTKKGYTIPFHIQDEHSNIPLLYYHESIPYTLIINKNGKIVKSSLGAEDWDDKQFIAELKQML